MSSDLSSNQDSTMGVLAGVQDTCQGLSDRLSQQVIAGGLCMPALGVASA